ncbi:MAG: DUF3990 domain-containing protein [Erysipelotrichaceae bacterium]|nr:DUF3990 domain-containing protein [Erysipelotrichaceae bacterium]
MKLYHTGKTEIRNPDVHYGRKNADFGQGFYLTPDVDFAYRWAVDDAVLNEYELDETGLLIKLFSRDEQWFEYIFNNRRNSDSIEADVIIGPIANDTIFETYGIISSGFLKPADAMKLLMIGPQFTQIALKTEKAVRNLKFIRAERIERIDSDQKKEEQRQYAEIFDKTLQTITDEISKGEAE